MVGSRIAGSAPIYQIAPGGDAYAGEAFTLQRSRSDPDEKLIDALKLTLHQMSSFKAFLPFQGKESLQPV